MTATTPGPSKSKTAPPKSEANSHKPTFGAASERPGTEQAEPEADRSLPQETREELQRQIDEQANQIDPDKFQRNISNPTTEDVVASPKSQPTVIDPMTGKVHHGGEVAELKPQAGTEGSA